MKPFTTEIQRTQCQQGLVTAQTYAEDPRIRVCATTPGTGGPGGHPGSYNETWTKDPNEAERLYREACAHLNGEVIGKFPF